MLLSNTAERVERPKSFKRWELSGNNPKFRQFIPKDKKEEYSLYTVQQKFVQIYWLEKHTFV